MAVSLHKTNIYMLKTRRYGWCKDSDFIGVSMIWISRIAIPEFSPSIWVWYAWWSFLEWKIRQPILCNLPIFQLVQSPIVWYKKNGTSSEKETYKWRKERCSFEELSRIELRQAFYHKHRVRVFKIACYLLRLTTCFSNLLIETCISSVITSCWGTDPKP